MTTSPLKQKIQIVTLAENQLLLLQFAKFHNQGFQNITGSVEKDETFEMAAWRELKEEIGTDSGATLLDINKAFHFLDRWGFEVEEKVFLCLFPKIPQIIISDEHQSFKWVPVENVSLKDFVFPTNFESFQASLKFMKEQKK